VREPELAGLMQPADRKIETCVCATAVRVAFTVSRRDVLLLFIRDGHPTTIWRCSSRCTETKR